MSEQIDREKHDRVWTVDGEHSHYATFVFMYRTDGKWLKNFCKIRAPDKKHTDVLRAQNIIPARMNLRFGIGEGEKAVRQIEVRDQQNGGQRRWLAASDCLIHVFVALCAHRDGELRLTREGGG